MNQTQPAAALEIEKIDETTCQVSLTLPAETITEQKKNKLLKIRKTARVDGFRKNHVPLSVIERMYGQGTLTEVVNELCWDAWQKAVKDHKIEPIGQPNFHIADEIQAGLAVNFSVQYQVMPEIILGDYSAIQVDKEEGEVTEADVDATIDQILTNQTHWHKVERPSLLGDAVLVDMEYTLVVDDDLDPVVQKQEGQKVVLGDDFAVPELLPHLIGVKAGDTINCEAAFPESFQNAAWRGQKAQFSLDITEVEHPHRPELNDDFAKKMGVDEKEENLVEAFRQKIRKNLEFELHGAIRKKFKDKLLTQVLGKTDIPIPQAAEDYYNKMARREMMKRYLSPEQLKQYGDTPENALPAEGFADKAKKDAGIGILIEEIERQRNMDVTEAEIRAVAEELSVQYDSPDGFIQQMLDDQYGASQCRQLAVENKVVRWLESQVQVNLVTKSYKEVFEDDSESLTEGDAADGSAALAAEESIDTPTEAPEKGEN